MFAPGTGLGALISSSWSGYYGMNTQCPLTDCINWDACKSVAKWVPAMVNPAAIGILTTVLTGDPIAGAGSFIVACNFQGIGYACLKDVIQMSSGQQPSNDVSVADGDDNSHELSLVEIQSDGEEKKS